MSGRKESGASSNQLRQRRIALSVAGWRMPERSHPELITVDGGMQEQIIEDVVGEEISRQRIRDLYGLDGHVAFWGFAKVLKESGGSRFCVSHTIRNFEMERGMRFYEVGEGVVEGDLKVIYLGQGKTPFTPEILNTNAAEALGFSVLKLTKTDEVTDK